MRRLVLSMLLAAACGSDNSKTTGSGTVTGTVAGKSFGAKDAAFVSQNLSGFAFSGTSTAVLLTDFVNVCSLETAKKTPPNGQNLFLALAALDNTGTAHPPTATGDYLVLSSVSDSTTPNSLRSDVYYELDGPDCQKSNGYVGTSGKVTVTSISSTQIKGTFDLSLKSGDHLTGSFDSKSCPGMDFNVTPSCP